MVNTSSVVDGPIVSGCTTVVPGATAPEGARTRAPFAGTLPADVLGADVFGADVFDAQPSPAPMRTSVLGSFRPGRHPV